MWPRTAGFLFCMAELRSVVTNVTASSSVLCWWTLGWFHFLAILTQAAVTGECRCLFEIVTSAPSDMHSKAGLLGHTAVLFLIIALIFNYLRTFHIYSPVYIPTNSPSERPFLHIPVGLLLCLGGGSCSDGCEVVSHCGCDLPVPDAESCWAHFLVLAGYWAVYSEKNLVKPIF